MRAKKVERLFEQIPEEVILNGKLLIDATPISAKSSRKRTTTVSQSYRFIVLSDVLDDKEQACALHLISEEIGSQHVVYIEEGNEVVVTFDGVDFPLLEELDVRVAAVIGVAAGYAPEDVLLYIEDGAGSKGRKDATHGISGTKVLVDVGEVYPRTLMEDSWHEPATVAA